MKTAVIMSPHFPPCTLAGVHRARHLVKHLPAHGWRPVLLRVAPDHYVETPDPALARLVPEDLAQVQTAALPARLTRKIGIGDLGIRALPYLWRALERTIERERPDAVLLTGAPFYPLLLSSSVARKFDVPVVVDLQDPWVSAYGRSQPFFSKRRMANRVASVLEPIALRSAAAVTSVSDTQNAELRKRHPFLADRPMEAIPIGGDPEDFEALRRDPTSYATLRSDPDKTNFAYVGTFLPRAAPLVRMLFKALKQVEVDTPAIAGKLRFNFVGTSNQPTDVAHSPVADLAREEGVGHLVHETPRRVPFLEALDLLANSDGLLMVGSDEPHYTASKIYPNLMARRPFLSLFHVASSSHETLTQAGGGIALAFANLQTLATMKADIAAAIVRLATAPESLGKSDPVAYAPFTAEAIAGRYAALFDQLISAAELQR